MNVFPFSVPTHLYNFFISLAWHTLSRTWAEFNGNYYETFIHCTNSDFLIGC